jgi:ribosomal protein S18 acetylase RimI-like enzyme
VTGIRVAITQAAEDRLPALASLLGRTFVAEPMMTWSLGDHGDLEQRFTRGFEHLLEDLIRLGAVWEAGDALGAAVWIPPDKADAWADAALDKPGLLALTADGGRRYTAFWEWIESKVPDEPLWHLDSVGVEPEARGRGIGTALVEVGLAGARDGGAAAFLETGNPRNVGYYERRGFRVVEDVDAPDGGPHMWFMRWDP